jgi:hypothetical protein
MGDSSCRMLSRARSVPPFPQVDGAWRPCHRSVESRSTATRQDRKRPNLVHTRLEASRAGGPANPLDNSARSVLSVQAASTARSTAPWAGEDADAGRGR